MTNMRKWNYIISVIAILLGTGVIIANAKFPIEFGNGDPGAGFWPTMLGGFLIGLGILLAAATTKKKEDREKTFSVTLPGNLLVYRFMVLTVLFCVVMYVGGLLLAALVFLPVAMHMLGARGKSVIIIDLLTVAAIYIIFARMLHTPLPEPIWLR